jgi:carbon-monoxide dehydrogenase medium subunit
MVALQTGPLTIHRSRKLIPEFRLHRPQTAALAMEMKAALGPGAVFMAGGIDVVDRMKYGAPITDVIHLGGIAGLDQIEDKSGELRLGALVTHDRLATSAAVLSRLPAVAETWPDVANIRVRCKGTIGGNVMSGESAYDFALAVMAGNARLHFLTASGSREVVGAIRLGPTRPDAILSAISFPSCDTLKLRFDRSLRPIVTIALGLDVDVADNRITGGRIAIGCAYATPVVAALPIHEKLPMAELMRRTALMAEELAAGLSEPLRDHQAGSNYRRRMIEILLRRNLSAIAAGP